MRTAACILISLCWLLPNASLAQIELEPSKLLEPPPLILAQMEDEDEEGGKSFTEIEREGEIERKNPWQALGQSLLIPGLGQRYVGSNLKAGIFIAAEVGFWSALISFRHRGDWYEDDYRLLAEANAGADLTDKDDRYFDVLGFYESREEYNKLGGVYNRDQQYYPDNQFYFWKWDSEESRERYRDLKNRSKSFYRDAEFALGLIVANHVISAVDAYFGAKRHNRQVQSGFWGVDLQPEPGGFMLTVRAGI
jgi:hypothetical protein